MQQLGDYSLGDADSHLISVMLSAPTSQKLRPIMSDAALMSSAAMGTILSEPSSNSIYEQAQSSELWLISAAACVTGFQGHTFARMHTPLTATEREHASAALIVPAAERSGAEATFSIQEGVLLCGKSLRSVQARPLSENPAGLDS